MGRWGDKVISIPHKSPASSLYPPESPGHRLGPPLQVLNPLTFLCEKETRKWQAGWRMPFLVIPPVPGQRLPHPSLLLESALVGSDPIGFLVPARVGKGLAPTVRKFSQRNHFKNPQVCIGGRRPFQPSFWLWRFGCLAMFIYKSIYTRRQECSRAQMEDICKSQTLGKSTLVLF